jgi:hypothetical protein
MSAGTTAGVVVAAIFVGAAIVGAVYRKPEKMSGHVQLLDPFSEGVHAEQVLKSNDGGGSVQSFEITATV